MIQIFKLSYFELAVLCNHDRQVFVSCDQQQQQYGGAYGQELEEDDIEGLDSDENFHGMYAEGLADRIWDETDD